MVPARSSTREPAMKQNDTSERNKAIVRALYEAYNRRDYEAAFAHKAEDYTIEGTGTSWVSGRFQGRDYVRYELLPRVFPEGVTFRLGNHGAEGDGGSRDWAYEGR